MIRVRLVEPSGPDGVREWRDRARALIAARIPPGDVAWDTAAAPDLDLGESLPETAPSPALRIPRELDDLLARVGCHRAPERHAEMYEALWRVAHGERHLLDLRNDPLVHRLAVKDAAIRREMHKTKAFVRFTPQATPEGETVHVAWFEPEHDALECVIPFFERRFANMRWAILTPRVCFHWDGAERRRSPGIAPPDLHDADPLAAAWNVYYASIFNPARVKTRTMVQQMPRRYWRNLPEAELIPRLVAYATDRETRMLDAAPLPVLGRSRLLAEPAPLPPLDRCDRCAHAARATQAVAGEGPDGASIMIVGEQPGDAEDLEGRPFVGPAGAILDRALAAVGIDRAACYLTNAVKHFLWEPASNPRGKRRIHKTPGQREMLACREHLLAELVRVRPRVIVALGRTAAKALLEGTPEADSPRGTLCTMPSGVRVVVTHHPAYLLRGADERALRAELEADLRTAREAARP